MNGEWRPWHRERYFADHVRWGLQGCVAPWCPREAELLADYIEGAGGLPFCLDCCDRWLDRQEAIAYCKSVGVEWQDMPPLWEPPYPLRPAERCPDCGFMLRNCKCGNPDWNIPF